MSDYWNWTKGLDPARPPKPADVPSNPHQVYRERWISFSDYLGTRRVANYHRKFRPFEEAREFAQALALGTGHEWREYASGRLNVPGMSPRPADIPSNPNFTYKTTGWAGMKDWLGTGEPCPPQLSRFRPFPDARVWARSLRLAGWLEWRNLVREKQTPADIPAIPHAAYRGEGWQGYGDWLGTEQLANHQIKLRSFEEARDFSRQLNIKTIAEWRAYCGGRTEAPAKPTDIPYNPDKAYPKQWRGWLDWLSKPRS